MPIPATHLAHVIVLTDRHYILGEIATFGRRLSDVANDRRSRNLELERARVNRSDRPEELLGLHDRLVVKKSAIQSILLITEPPRQTQQRLSTYVPKTPAPIAALLPVLMISGSVHLAARVDPAVWTLDPELEPFVAVSNARVHLTHRQGPPIPVPVALVNRARIEAVAATDAAT